jgi:hypothetical protein
MTKHIKDLGFPCKVNIYGLPEYATAQILIATVICSLSVNFSDKYNPKIENELINAFQRFRLLMTVDYSFTKTHAIWTDKKFKDFTINYLLYGAQCPSEIHIDLTLETITIK